MLLFLLTNLIQFVFDCKIHIITFLLKIENKIVLSIYELWSNISNLSQVDDFKLKRIRASLMGQI